MVVDAFLVLYDEGRATTGKAAAGIFGEPKKHVVIVCVEGVLESNGRVGDDAAVGRPTGMGFGVAGGKENGVAAD